MWAIPAPGGGNRAFCDRMNGWAQGEGQPGLGYIFWREGEDGGAGPIAKNIGPERTALVRAFERARLPEGLPAEVVDPYFALRPAGLQPGDAVFFVAGLPATMAKFAALARQRVARGARADRRSAATGSPGSSTSRCTSGTSRPSR